MANERSKSTSFIDHALRIETSDGPRWKMPLHAKSFHAAIMAALSDVGTEAHIHVQGPDNKNPSKSETHIVHGLMPDFSHPLQEF